MKTFTKIKKYILLSVICLLMLNPLSSRASESKDNFNFIISLINEIRTDPLGRAEDLGYDRDTLKTSLPWLEEAYFPYERDSFLDVRATARNHLDEEIPDPEISPEHDYARTGETGGVVTFFNFLSPDNAARIVVENIFKQELNPEKTTALHILSRDFTRLGISMDARMETVGQYRQNAYFITLCFGSSQLRSEVQVLTMVNQVRSQPSSLITYLGNGTSIIELLDNNLNFISEWFKKYPPLMDNFFLHQSAQKYAEQLVDTGRTSSALSSDPLIRALDMGYQGTNTTESLILKTLSANETTGSIANAMFSHLVEEELKAAPQRGAIFSQETNEGGMGISFFAVNDQIQIISSVLDVGLAKPEDNEKICIYGMVYSDKDKNNIYSPGEGHELASLTIIRKSDDLIIEKIITDLEGHFTTSIEANEAYLLEISTGGFSSSLEILPNQNIFLPIKITLPSENLQQ